MNARRGYVPEDDRNFSPDAIKKIYSYPRADVYATRDTHPENYLETQEGKYLPLKHCIKGRTSGRSRGTSLP